MKYLLTLLLSLSLLGPSWSDRARQAPPDEQNSVVQERLRRAIPDLGDSGASEFSQAIRKPKTKGPALKGMRPAAGNAHVEQAPKSWPYPMVVGPGRPVLPGSVW